MCEYATSMTQAAGRGQLLTPHIRSVMVHPPSTYRLAVFGALHSGDGLMAGSAVRFLAAALLNESLQTDVLDACGEPYTLILIDYLCTNALYNPYDLRKSVLLHDMHALKQCVRMEGRQQEFYPLETLGHGHRICCRPSLGEQNVSGSHPGLDELR